MSLRRDDPAWLFYAEKEEIARVAFRDVARMFALILFAILIGCAVAPLLLDHDSRAAMFAVIRSMR